MRPEWSKCEALVIAAKEALEDYIQYRQHIGPNDVNLAAVALSDLEHAVRLIKDQKEARVAVPHGDKE